MTAVTAGQRYNQTRPCPVCHGWGSQPRGRALRCSGFLSADARFAHCSREELGGGLPQEAGGTFAHLVIGPCRCGAQHGPAMPDSRASASMDGSVIKLAHILRDADGATVAVHHRLRKPDGSKSVWWTLPDGTPKLNRPAASLPVYGVEALGGTEDGSEVVVVEGEPARDALTGRGVLAVGTVTGADGCPDDAALRPLVRLVPILWPDSDGPGLLHMQRVAGRLLALGVTPRLIEWADAPPKGDAADFPGDDDALQALIDAARPYRVGEAQADFSLAGLRMTRLSDVQAEEVHWRWKDRLPVGKLVILEGDPGVGKSWLTLAIATAVTKGAGIAGDAGQFNPQGVLLFTAEDGLADTVRARIDAMDADADRIDAVDAVTGDDGKVRFPNLSDDIALIDAALAKGGYGLVIFDPLNAYLAGIDGNRDIDLRSVLGPLSQLAERHNVTVIAVRHLTKSGRDRAIYRGAGGIGYTAAARTVLLCGVNPDDTEQRVVAVIKNNLAPLAPSIAFSITDGVFVWLGESDVQAAALLAADAPPEEKSALREAVDFLRSALADGSLPQTEIERQCRQLGLSMATVRRAKQAAGVVVKPQYEQGRKGAVRWLWSLPAGLDDQVFIGDHRDHLNGSAPILKLEPPMASERVDHRYEAAADACLHCHSGEPLPSGKKLHMLCVGPYELAQSQEAAMSDELLQGEGVVPADESPCLRRSKDAKKVTEGEA